jgi:hypothetical protein
MARIPVDPNYSFPTFPRATAATDIFVKEDVQALAAAVSTHVHDGAGKGLLVGGPAAGSITNAMLGADVARENQLTNGGFEVWQRGNGPFTTPSPVFTADRWVINGAGATLSVTRNTANVDAASTACAAITVTAWTGELYLTNTPEHLKQLLGRTISFSLRVRTSTPNAVRAVIATDVGPFAYSAYHTGGGAYETLTATALIAPNVTILSPSVAFGANSTVYVDNANLVVGSQAANYVPLHPADDLARCLRYYEPLGGAGGTDIVVNSYAVGAATPIQVPFQFRAVKAVVPTVTKNGTWGVVNSAQPVVNVPTVLGFYVGAAAVAAGMVNFYNTGPGTNFTAESNP